MPFRVGGEYQRLQFEIEIPRRVIHRNAIFKDRSFEIVQPIELEFGRSVGVAAIATSARNAKRIVVEIAEAKRIIPSLPVLVITGYGDISMAVTALKAGASDFIVKPLDRQSFLSAVESVLRRNALTHPLVYSFALCAAKNKNSCTVGTADYIILGQE